MDIEINAPNPDKPDEGIVTSHRVIPGKGIQKVRDDLFRNPTEASEATMDDSPEGLLG